MTKDQKEQCKDSFCPFQLKHFKGCPGTTCSRHAIARTREQQDNWPAVKDGRSAPQFPFQENE